MTLKLDWLPKKNAAIYAKLRSYLGLVVTNKVAWGIADVAIQPLLDLQAEFEPLYLKISDKRRRTSSDVTAFNDCKKRLLAEWRAFHKEEVRGNRKISPQDLAALVGKEFDLEPSPGQVITDTPYMALRTVGRAQIEVRAQTTEDATRTSMPAFANLIECRFVVLEQGDIAPDNPENFTKKEVSSRSKFILHVGEQNAGKKFWGVFRWVNTARPKQEGPWTDPISITIG